jgi:adenine-specific DNA-methyltransferase
MHDEMSRLVKSDRTLKRARGLRGDMTEPERLLWMMLRDRRFAGFKIRRQAPLGDFVVDFVCYGAKLVIELDGSQHCESEQFAFDEKRAEILEAAGFRILRIASGHLYTDRGGVLETIWNTLNEPRSLRAY